MSQQQLTDREVAVAERGFEEYEKVEKQLEEALRLAGAAGDPRAFIVLFDVEAPGSTDDSRIVELYVLGNMPAPMAEHAVPIALERYLKEQANAGSGAG